MATAKKAVKPAYPADLKGAVKAIDEKVAKLQAEIVELDARKLDLENQIPVREATAYVGRTYVKRGTCRTNGEGIYARVLSASKDHPGNVILEVFQCVGGGVKASFSRDEMDWIHLETVYEPLSKADFERFRSEARKAIG